MAAVVGDNEGPKTKFEVVKVAPKNDEQPTLQVGDGNNNTIEVKILAPNANMECEVSWRRQILTIFSYKNTHTQVESYQVRYQTLGEDADEEFTSAELSDGIIVLTEVDNKMVEGRIKYLDYDWSPWTESQKTEVSLVSSLLVSELPSVHCLISGEPVNPRKQGNVGPCGDCGAAGGGDPRHRHLLHCEEEEKVTKQI